MSIDLRKGGVSLLGDIKYVAHTWHEGSVLLHIPSSVSIFDKAKIYEDVLENTDFSYVHFMSETSKEDVKGFLKVWERVYL